MIDFNHHNFLFLNVLFYLYSTNNVQLSTNQTLQNNQLQLQLDTLKAMPYGDSPLFKRFYKVNNKEIKEVFIYNYIVIIKMFVFLGCIENR